MRGRNVSIKNRFAKNNEGKLSMSVGEYIDKKEFRKNCTGTLVNGEMYVTVNGVLLKQSDFDRVYPEPFVPSFNHDVNGVDQKSNWLYK